MTQKEWREANREKCREHGRTYYQLHRDKIREKQRQYRQSNLDTIRERARRYYWENRDQMLERARTRRTPEQAEYQRKWRQHNPEKIREYKRREHEGTHAVEKEVYLGIISRESDYYQRHKDSILAKSRRKRAQNRLDCIALLGGNCTGCGKRDALHLDHIAANHPRTQSGNRVKGSAIVSQILKGKYPITEWQLLCPACHAKKTTQENMERGRGRQ